MTEVRPASVFVPIAIGVGLWIGVILLGAAIDKLRKVIAHRS